MIKLNWSMTSKEVMIRNITKVERALQSATGREKKRLSRYVSYMKSALRRKGFAGPINTIQPTLTGFNSAVDTPDFSQALIEKIVNEVIGKLEVDKSFSGIKGGKFYIKGKEVTEKAYTGYLAGLKTHIKRLEGIDTTKAKEMRSAKRLVGIAKKLA